MTELNEVVHGFITGSFASLLELVSRASAKRYRKRTLRRLLSHSRYKWRTIKRLATSIDQDYETTRILLIEIGARRSEGEKEVWTLQNN